MKILGNYLFPLVAISALMCVSATASDLRQQQAGCKNQKILSSSPSSSGNRKTLNEETFSLLGSKKSGEALISEMFTAFSRSEEGKFIQNEGRVIDSKILVFISPKYLPEVGKYGLRNYHQLGHSNGLEQKEFRLRAESWLIDAEIKSACDLLLDCPLHALRPKYGILQPKSHAEGYVNIKNLSKYGEAIIVLKDKVKLRTSYTLGDSLDGYKADTIPEYAMTGIHLQKAQAAASLNTLRTQPENFIEAQIWGAVDPSDIEEIRIPPSNQEMLDYAVKLGVPVYSYDRSFFTDNVQNFASTLGYVDLDDFSKAVARNEKLYDGEQAAIEQFRKINNSEALDKRGCE